MTDLPLPIGRVAMVVCWLSCLLLPTNGATWSVAPTNALPLDTSGSGLTVGGMSGVTYLGPSPLAGKHRFLTVQDTGAGILTFDAAFDLSGNVVSAEAVSNQPVSPVLDYEGITQVGSSVFVSDENGPGVREFDPATGAELQNLGIPTLFTDHARGNFGFESLAYDPVGARLWTANEAALTVDGGIATSTTSTTVRLLEFDQAGDSFTPSNQYAYTVEPIHGNENSSTRSGLVEIVSLPDGTLLTLERSLAASLSPYRSRVYEVDFAGATDVSMPPFDTGLDGETFTPVSKELLWLGAAGGGFGQNLEGLTVGPRLPNGDWILLGVVDDGGSADFLSSNTIVAFTAASAVAIPFGPVTGDFDQDGDLDGADFLDWQRGLGGTTLAGIGDGNHDGQVTAADLALWENQFGAAAALAKVQAVPEPTTLGMGLMFAIAIALRRVNAGSAGSL